jgi:transposase
VDAAIAGIDVAKDKLDVSLRPSGERFVVARDSAGLDDLIARCRAARVTMVGLEATGGYETVVAASLSGPGSPRPSSILRKVRSFAKALDKPAKTDPIDAEVIAHFIEATKPAARTLPDEAARAFSGLVGRRSQIIAMIQAEQQRKGRCAGKRLPRSIERLLKALQKELSALDGQIEEAVEASPLRAPRTNCWRASRAGQGRQPRQRWRERASLDARARRGHAQTTQLDLDSQDSRSPHRGEGPGVGRRPRRQVPYQQV